jgi:divalent metal cation (Fe/Co/Zn/Cd) transporter
VLLGAGGVAVGWDWADPVVGLLITVAIVAVLRQAAREIYRRLMDAVDPHQVAVDAEHGLLHALPRLTAALVHADPQPQDGTDHHAALASHQ